MWVLQEKERKETCKNCSTTETTAPSAYWKLLQRCQVTVGLQTLFVAAGRAQPTKLVNVPTNVGVGAACTWVGTLKCALSLKNYFLYLPPSSRGTATAAPHTPLGSLHSTWSVGLKLGCNFCCPQLKHSLLNLTYN
jgi:hypothetical protein